MKLKLRVKFRVTWNGQLASCWTNCAKLKTQYCGSKLQAAEAGPILVVYVLEETTSLTKALAYATLCQILNKPGMRNISSLFRFKGWTT